MKMKPATLAPAGTLPDSPIEFSRPSWRPLQRVLPGAENDFMYMGHVGALQLYKHRDTRRYLNVHEETGRCYLHTERGYVPCAIEIAIERVLRHEEIYE